MERVYILIPLIILVSSTISFAEEQWTTHVTLEGKQVPIEDGVDLSAQNLNGVVINRYEAADPNFRSRKDTSSVGYGTLKNIKFDGSYIINADLGEVKFDFCSFKKTTLIDTGMSQCMSQFYRTSDFTDAFFCGCIKQPGMPLTKEQIQTTRNYKMKIFNRIEFLNQDLSHMDFRNFDFRECVFCQCKLTCCDFTDAQIAGVEFRFVSPIYFNFNDESNMKWLEQKIREGQYVFDFSIEYLLVTKDFKDDIIERVRFDRLHWPPDKVIDLSNKTFRDCHFGYSDATARINLTDSVILKCNFEYFHGLTLENVKSTWNYKHNRMEGIKLPEEIQKALDAEKKKQ